MPTDQYALFARFGISLLLGLLVGLEREWAKGANRTLFAGIRSFPLIALMGALATLVGSEEGAGWFLPAAFFGFALLVAASHFVLGATPGHGTTTEITSLLVFMIGALAFRGHFGVAAALTVMITLVLSMKEPLHELAHRVESQDIYATLKFAVVSLIVLPLLPDAPLTALLPERFLAIPQSELLSVLNLRRIWLLVVFVSGIAFIGYIATKVVGARRGIALTGVLGGIVSSTAVAVSMAERSREEEQLSPQYALAVVLGSTVMFPRTVIEVAFVNLPLGGQVMGPLLGAAVFGVLASGYLWFRGASQEAEGVKLRNPFRLAPAFKFGLLFTAMLVLSKYAAARFETAGIFVASAVGGLIDTRPIALSVANLALEEHAAVGEGTAIAAVMIAALSNTFLKGALAAAMGARSFRRLILPAFVLLVAGGIVATFAVAKYGLRLRIF